MQRVPTERWTAPAHRQIDAWTRVDGQTNLVSHGGPLRWLAANVQPSTNMYHSSTSLPYNLSAVVSWWLPMKPSFQCAPTSHDVPRPTRQQPTDQAPKSIGIYCAFPHTLSSTAAPAESIFEQHQKEERPTENCAISTLPITAHTLNTGQDSVISHAVTHTYKMNTISSSLS